MDYWSYALINHRLGELYFTRKRGKVVIEGHSYLHRDERLTKVEAAALQHDISHNQYTYYRRRYHYRSSCK